jgi:hypothetical protein
MPSKHITEAVAILRDAENSTGRLMQNLMTIISNLDRSNYELLIENILIKKHGQIVGRTYKSDYADYKLEMSDVEHHRAYVLFNKSDFEATVAEASDDLFISDFYIYMQRGYQPKANELHLLSDRGVNIVFVNVQSVARNVLIYDLLQWIIAVSARDPTRMDDVIKGCLLGQGCHPGISDATIFLLEQLNEDDFAEVVHGIFILQGCVGKQKTEPKGSEFTGICRDENPFYFRTKTNPGKADFETFYQVVLEMQKTAPKLRGYFCHLTDVDPDFCVLEAKRDPDSKFGEIDSLKALQLVGFFDASSWLRRWLIHRFIQNGKVERKS